MSGGRWGVAHRQRLWELWSPVKAKGRSPTRSCPCKWIGPACGTQMGPEGSRFPELCGTLSSVTREHPVSVLLAQKRGGALHRSLFKVLRNVEHLSLRKETHNEGCMSVGLGHQEPDVQTGLWVRPVPTGVGRPPPLLQGGGGGRRWPCSRCHARVALLLPECHARTSGRMGSSSGGRGSFSLARPHPVLAAPSPSQPQRPQLRRLSPCWALGQGLLVPFSVAQRMALPASRFPHLRPLNTRVHAHLAPSCRLCLSLAAWLQSSCHRRLGKLSLFSGT